MMLYFQQSLAHSSVDVVVTTLFIDYIFYSGLTLVSARISNHMPSKVWGEITYPFLN